MGQNSVLHSELSAKNGQDCKQSSYLKHVVIVDVVFVIVEADVIVLVCVELVRVMVEYVRV